ncbi:MAG: dihydrofolate reductase family protein [Vicinamibacterales bacterium]
MFMTADGFIAGPNGEFDTYEPSTEEHEMANAFFRGADAIVFGRVCYQGFVEYWDALDVTSPATPPPEADFAKAFRNTPLVVVSRTLTDVVPRATLIGDSLVPSIGALKQRWAGYAVLVCGPELLATLMDAGLVDELRLLIKPSLQGRGLALFRDLRQHERLTLLGTRAFDSGTVLHHYRTEPR